MTTLIVSYFHTIVQFNLPVGNPVTQIFVLRTFMPLYNTKRTDENPVWYCTVSLLSHCAIQPYMWQRCGIIVLYSKVWLLYNSIKWYSITFIMWYIITLCHCLCLIHHVDSNPVAYCNVSFSRHCTPTWQLVTECNVWTNTAAIRISLLICFLLRWPGGRSVQRTQRTFCFLFATANSLRAERSLFSKRSRVNNIYSNSSVIAHSLGDIGYFCVMRKTL